MAGGRGRGWLSVAALALVVAVFAVVSPTLLIFVPLALLLVALPPRRPLLVAVAGLIFWLVFGAPAEGDSLWYLERGWALLLGAWFVLVIAVFPGWRFLPRALAAVGAALVTTAVVVTLTHGGLAPLDELVSERVRAGAAQALAMWSNAAGFERVSEQMTKAFAVATELQVKLYPALLALASVAALGVCWWAFGRVASDDVRPLAPLREFRFRDELVWLFVAGLLLLVLPANELAHRAGENLFTFMAVLYALRGAAVLVVIGGVPGPLGLVLGGLLIVFLYPIVMAATFVVGLSDTWLDIRARRQASSDSGS